MRRVKLIRIQNILGIEDAEIEPGLVTVIEGGNASGKTSVLEAIRAAIGGGHDATLVRDGAEEGTVVLVLDDETQVEKHIPRVGKSSTTVRHPDFGSVSAPQTWLDGVSDVLSFNPVSFLTSKTRAQDLLHAIPMEVSKERLEGAIGDVMPTALQGLRPGHALEVIEQVRKVVYDERTGVNRTAKDKAKTAEQLRASLPADGKTPVTLAQELHDAEGAHRDADSTLRQKLAEVDAEVERKAAAVKDATNVKIRKLQEDIRKAETKGRDDVAKIRAEASGIKDAVLEGRVEVNRLGTRAAELREQLRHADRDENTRAIVAEAERDAAAAEERSRALSEAITRLEGLRGQLQEAIPIEGVTIESGQVMVDGHPFHRANRARQVRVAVGVAKLRAGKLPLVCIDELECLDRATFEAFLEELDGSGLQAILTRVAEGALRVRNGAPVGVEA